MTRRENTNLLRTFVLTLAGFAFATSTVGQEADFLPAESLRAVAAYGNAPDVIDCCRIMAALESTGQRRNANSSEWASFDKVQHVTFSFLLTLGTQYTLVNKLDVSTRPATPLSAATGVSVGVAKELYDRRFGRSGQFDFKDLVADLLGVALATGLILI